MGNRNILKRLLCNKILQCPQFIECCIDDYYYILLYYRKYIDYIFVLFNSAEHLNRFHSYLN